MTIQSPSVLTSAVSWIEELLLGSMGTSVAIVAVVLVGYSLLTGRASARRGLAVIIGAFILFSAPTLARALVGLTQGPIGPNPLAALPPPPPPQYTSPLARDPYAGASVPQ